MPPPELDWQTAAPSSQRMHARKLAALGRDLLARGTRAWLVLRGGQALIEQYAPGLGPADRHGTASLAKSLVGGMSLLLALEDGRLRLDDPAARWIPTWHEHPLKRRITLRQLATHTSGIEDSETPGRTHFDQGGWKEAFWRREPDPFSIAVHQAPLVCEPGSRFEYSNPGVAALAYALTAALQSGPQRDLFTLLAERIMRPLGLPDEDWTIGYEQAYRLDGLDLYAAWGGGAFTARAAARVGQLLLNQGLWGGRQLFSSPSLRQVLAPQPPYTPGLPAPASGWMTNANYLWPSLPRDAFVGAGAGHQVLLVVPSRGLLAVRFGALLSSPAAGPEFWASLDRHFFTPLMDCFLDRAAGDDRQAPCPPSPVIRGISFDPPSTILRRAHDSDNWPLTAAADGWHYTAYGDGQGFAPYTGVKLGLGLARLRGRPAALQAENIRAPQLENLAYGGKGRKASGLLMLGGTLYLLARNAANSRLAWSPDQGRTWTWCDWAFTQSFGHPGFINFGPDYAGARDEFVYLYSHDGDSAYQPADHMVMARVPRAALLQREAYRFFAGLESAGQPRWSAEIGQRAPVFSHPGRCLRSAMTYHPGLKRYLWWQQTPLRVLEASPVGGEADTRFQGGFGIYDAPEPWGPWTTAYFTLEWDCGPGELGSLPAAWTSPGGRGAYQVFSGYDAFSVRRAWLRIDK